MRTRLLPGLAVLLAVLLAPAGAQAARTLLISEQQTGRLGAFDVTREGAPTAFPGGPVTSGAAAGGVAISPDARFAFVSNTQADTVRPFAIGDDRTLTAVSAAVASGGTDPAALTVTPDGRRLLVAHRTGGTVSVFDINQATGALTAAALGQPVGGSVDDVTSVVVSRDGRFAYAAGRGPSGPPSSNSDTRLASFLINANGTLTPLLGSPTSFAGAIGGFGLSITPNGNRLYLTFVQAQAIRAFNLDTSSGIATGVPGSPFAAGAQTQQGFVGPDGGRLYAHDVFGNAVLGYTLNAATGAPTAISGSPFTVGAGNQPAAVALAPDGRTLFAAIQQDPSIFAGFAVGTTGGLTALPGSPFAGPGTFTTYYGAAITPTQTPAGTVAVTAGEPGKPSSLVADVKVRGGFVTRYAWDFGDGTTIPDGASSAVHTYAAAGTYTAKLTVTNDCDPAAVFVNGSVYTGRTTYCNGPPTATFERSVVVSSAPAPAPTPTPTPAAFTVARAFTIPSAKRCLKRPARLTLRFRRPGGVTIDRVEVRVAGKRVVRRTGAAARKSVTLRKLPSKAFTLTVKVTPRGGKTVTSTRKYTVCKPARRA